MENKEKFFVLADEGDIIDFLSPATQTLFGRLVSVETTDLVDGSIKSFKGILIDRESVINESPHILYLMVCDQEKQTQEILRLQNVIKITDFKERPFGKVNFHWTHFKYRKGVGVQNRSVIEKIMSYYQETGPKGFCLVVRDNQYVLLSGKLRVTEDGQFLEIKPTRGDAYCMPIFPEKAELESFRVEFFLASDIPEKFLLSSTSGFEF